MNQPIEPVNPPALKWIGRLLTLPPAALLIMSGVMKLMKPDMVTEGWAKSGYPANSLVPIGVVELVCTLLFLIPQTAVLGAVLLTGYLGGATATHVRAGDPWGQIFTPVIIGAVLWLALVLRDHRLRGLLPIRFAAHPAQRRSIFVPILAVLGLVAIGFAGYVANRPDEFAVSRSVTIAAPPEAVFPQMNNLRKSVEWSPWTKLDPNMTTTYTGPEEGEGASYKWNGNDKVGEGSLTITESRPNELVRTRLEFVRPMEDKAMVDFTLHPEGEQTVVTWKMYGRQQFVQKAVCMFMNMDAMLGKDFEEGLQNLKTRVEAEKSKPAEPAP